eukprot:820802-Amphidinium_carterae.1
MTLNSHASRLVPPVAWKVEKDPPGPARGAKECNEEKLEGFQHWSHECKHNLTQLSQFKRCCHARQIASMECFELGVKAHDCTAELSQDLWLELYYDSACLVDVVALVAGTFLYGMVEHWWVVLIIVAFHGCEEVVMDLPPFEVIPPASGRMRLALWAQALASQ